MSKLGDVIRDLALQGTPGSPFVLCSNGLNE